MPERGYKGKRPVAAVTHSSARRFKAAAGKTITPTAGEASSATLARRRARRVYDVGMKLAKMHV